MQGQTLVLPMGDTFLYVSPLYLQATQARMPQLKKIVLAVGNRLIYADTYDEALARLGSGQAPAPAPAAMAATPAPAVAPSGDPRIQSIRQHLQRYRELMSQGKFMDAGRELEAVEAELRK